MGKWAIVTFGTILIAAVVTISGTPWPGAMLIRYLFESDAANVRAEMDRHAPRGVASIIDEPYRPGDDDALLDLYFPESTAATDALPTMIWIHGGAWISGHKDDAAPWLQLIANSGYTVISIGYSIAPRHRYPLPVTQVNDALTFITRHAQRLRVDPDRIVMAGDSSGAQIVSQIAALVTNPAYAADLRVVPTLAPGQLRGVVLFCGIFDMEAFAGGGERPGWLVEWGVNTVLRAYTGTRQISTEALRQMSTINVVTREFPPAFISGGNADPLTDHQSRPFADRLAELGVETAQRFYPADHASELGHEYQFHLDHPDGQAALGHVLTFLHEHTR